MFSLEMQNRSSSPFLALISLKANTMFYLETEIFWEIGQICQKVVMLSLVSYPAWF